MQPKYLVNTFKRLLCQWESPKVVASKLIQEWGEAGFIWLDGDGSDLGRWVTLAINPVEQMCSRKLKGSKTESNPFKIISTVLLACSASVEAGSRSTA